VVVVVVGGEERSLVAHPLLDIEPEHVAVEPDRPIEIGHLQVNVADVDARIDPLARHPFRVLAGRSPLR
jgi:hypothetical protein